MRHLVLIVLLSASLLLAQNSGPSQTKAEASKFIAAPQSAAPPTVPVPQGLPAYANYSIMLVNPGGVGVVLMHNPTGALEFVAVSNIKTSMDAGYVPLRAAELADLIQSLTDANAALRVENVRLSGEQRNPPTLLNVTTQPSEAEIQLRHEEMQRADERARRQQLLQVWTGMQRPPTQNVNVMYSNCNKNPALCVH